jgi:Domain of unknown function (DUF4410)
MMKPRGDIAMMTPNSKLTFKISTTILTSIAVGAILMAGSAAMKAENAASKFLVGGTKVTMLDSYKGKDQFSKPTMVMIYDFTLPEDAIKMDHSAAAAMQNHGVIAHVTGDAHGDTSATTIAAELPEAFSKTLQDELQKMGIATTTAGASAGLKVPEGTLVVHGEFTNVSLGSKSERMMVGFGLGASDVKAHVTVSLMTKNGPVTMNEFMIDSASGKKPGAAAGMGVGSVGMIAADVAVSSATDHKSAVASDTTRMAKATAKQIQGVMARQKWTVEPAVAQTGAVNGL